MKAENDGQTEAGTDSEANLTANSINADEVSEPTHYSKLDLKKMKVDELRCELAARNLDTKGLKQQLLNRLKDALEAEKVRKMPIVEKRGFRKNCEILISKLLLP